MTALPRFIAPGLLAPALLMAAGVQPAFASVPDPALPALIVPLTAGVLEELPRPLPDPVRAMIDAALASGEGKDIEIVVSLAKATNPKSVGEIEAILAAWQAQHESKPEPDPIRQMLAAAMATRKDGDVEAVGALAKKTNPERIADIDAMLVDYRARRTAEKKAAADAARAKLAAAKFWQNWKGEGQIGASQSSGNTKSADFSWGGSSERAQWIIGGSYFKQDEIASSKYGPASVPVPGTGLANGSSGTPTGRFVFEDPNTGETVDLTPNTGASRSARL